MRDDDDLDDGGRAGAVGGSDSGKVRSCESSLAGGWLGLLTGLDALYVSFAEVTNATFNKIVLPLGKPILKGSF